MTEQAHPSKRDGAAERIEITCADGARLQGHFLPASGGTPGLPVLLCPATGVRQHFYLRFATWLAQQGHDVLVFDYRGIGLSLHGPLRASQARLQDWGQLDQVAALDWLLHRTACEQVLMLGHSAGGQMIGLLPNHGKVARLVGVSASTGWFSGMRLGFRLKARFGLRLAMPLSILFKGYGVSSVLGLGENLPAGVARQWGQWCAAGGYATNAIRQHPERDFHAQVRTPMTVLHAADDDIANFTNRAPHPTLHLLREASIERAVRAFPDAARIYERNIETLQALGHEGWQRLMNEKTP